jgi:hypothetical protein
MTSLVDIRFAKLRELGFSGSTSDMVLAWLQSYGATSGAVTDAWMEVLGLIGFTGQRNDAWFTLLGVEGYTGSLNDREIQFWTNLAVGPPELVVNGSFADASGWAFNGAVWALGGGVATATAGAPGATLDQSSALFLNGRTYRLKYTISGLTAGSIKPVFVGSPNTGGATRTANGAYEEDLTLLGVTTVLRFNPVSTFTGSITGVSVKEVL